MEYELKHGQALVIAGPQGCGKSILARKIAEKYGAFIETDAHQLETRRGLNDLMASAPRTVICDGFPDKEEMRMRLKALITAKTIKVEPKRGALKIVNAPNFIFCTGDADPLPRITDDRRFCMIQLNAQT